MKKVGAICLLAVALLVLFAPPSLAGGRHRHGGTRVFVGVGGYFGPYYGYPYPYPYYYYPPPYYYYTPPAVVVQQPPVYVQQPAAAAPAPAPTQSATPAEGFWYYCQSSGDYYPKVSSCPEAWLKVAPRSE